MGYVIAVVDVDCIHTLFFTDYFLLPSNYGCAKIIFPCVINHLHFKQGLFVCAQRHGVTVVVNCSPIHPPVS